MEGFTSYFSGTSNVVLPVPNKTFFPPEHREKTRLGYYATLFNSVEVNSTFYKTPLGNTISKWASEVPDDFKFTFKLSKEVTHTNKLILNTFNLINFIEILNAAGEKFGCLLVQLPPSLSLDIPLLQSFLYELTQIKGSAHWHVAVEFRSKSWYTKTVYSLLEKFNAGMVFHDMPKSASPILFTTGHFAYLRFHGPESGYRGSYADDVLYEYSSFVNEWLDEGKTVYAYFNNTLGSAVKNLQTLNRFVRSEV